MMNTVSKGDYRMKIKNVLLCGGIMLMAALCVGKTDSTEAAVIVEANGTDDSANIQAELDSMGVAVLKKGETYRLKNSLILKNNVTVKAEGATIICEKPIAFNIPETADYNALSNVTIIGGTWKSEGSGYKGSSFKFTHANNITLKNMTIRAANLGGHSLEFVACQNVTVVGCDIAGVGKSNSKTEEAVQLDIASSVTAPYLKSVPFRTDLTEELWNHAGCRNVTIKDCKITGNRGVVANYTAKDGNSVETLHDNIVLKNNEITGLKGEGVVLFNTKNASVVNNKIKSLRKGKADAYTVGLHIANFSKNKDMNTSVITLSRNTVYGGRQAIMIYSHSGVKYGVVNISKNKLFCKAGKQNAIHANPKSIKIVNVSANTIKTYKDK